MIITQVPGCLKDGCQWHDEVPPRSCEKCGFYAPEAERRKNLPLEPDREGLWHKAVGAGSRAKSAKKQLPESRITAGALDVAVRIMEAAGLCRYDSREKCRRKGKSPSACQTCIGKWCRQKAQRELERMENHEI